MVMQPKHLTVQDDTKIHQVRFMMVANKVNISCNCRVELIQVTIDNDRTRWAHDPIGPTLNIEESRALYNDPANHWAPFKEEDKAKW